MQKSSKPIIKHIPDFLSDCYDKGLSERTYINYKTFLGKFLKWLEKENKETLLPHEITVADINSYKSYLTSFQNEKGQALGKATQNYYLIVLRALLNYFAAKDMESLPTHKVHLLKTEKVQKSINFLNQNQIRQLLVSPNASDPIGLRDRAILGISIYGGLKTDRLKNLNKNLTEQSDIIPKEALPIIKEYLKIRNDDCEALFINYRSGKHSHERLTARSIQRIINHYGKKVNLPFLITPETLRWSRANAILNKQIKIQKICSHKILATKGYNNRRFASNFVINTKKTKTHSPTWYVTENIIEKEIFWLKNNLSFLPEGYKLNPSFIKCDDCILRKLAILIVSGTVQATQFIRSKGVKDMWNDLMAEPDLKRLSKHGQEWHKTMMDVIYQYFSSKNYKVNPEPVLNYGRADLEIYSDSRKIIYIEVGTVSLYKLWYNLSTMKNVIFLLVPSEEIIIEFNT
jgi:site-specific recombinase XerD